MSEQELIYKILLAVPVLVAFVTPLLKLNTSITKLTILIDRVERDNAVRDERLNRYSERGDAWDRKLENHGARIDVLEKRECKFELSKKIGE